MHELSLAQNIVDIVKEYAEKEKAIKVNKVILEVGTISGVEKDALEFCFPIVAKDTIVSEAELIIEEIHVAANCKICNKTTDIDRVLFICKECNGRDYEIIRGKELSIKQIVVETPDIV